MMGSVLIPCTKAGFLLFVLLQTSLILYASAENNSTDSQNNTTTIGLNVTSVANQTLNATMAPNNTSTTGSNDTNSAMVSCRVFSCNYSACYNKFTSTNVTTCSAPANFCELRRDGDALYSVGCTSSCLSTCTNTSQNNCSINCCTTDCLNSTLNNLLNSSLIMTTTTSTTTTTTAKSSTVASTTMATNGKKCHKFSCNGDSCYQGNTNVALCAPGQNFCMLKKTPTVTWTASCIEDCSKETMCSSSNNNCILECCNATATASCLKLTGQVNIVGSGTMTLGSHMPLVVSSFFLWLLMMGKSAD